MKAILLSIKPEWAAKILNGEKTIEVRKKFPKDYVGWVYLYCSKGKTLQKQCSKIINGKMIDIHWNVDKDESGFTGFNGKVVARFWCDKVEEIYFEREVIGEICDVPMFPRTNSLSTQELIEKSCTKYLPYGETEIGNYLDDKGCAIHISKLEIFDRPKELGEFRSYKICNETDDADYDIHLPITKAPQNYCYVEGD